MECYSRVFSIPRPPHIGTGSWQLTNLSAITVLFGKNGSGKSLLLRTLRDHEIESSHYVVPERTGDLGFEASFLQQQMDANHRRSLSQRNFLADYRRHVFARVQTYFMQRGGVRAGQTLSVPPDDLEALLSMLLPDFAIELKPANPPYRLLRATGGEVGNVDQLSSGEAQLLTLGLDVLTIGAVWELQGAPRRILLADEPDAHIHPDLQARFADFLVQAGTRFKIQVVVASHSTTLLAALGQFGKENTSVIYLDRTTSVFRAHPFDAVLKEVAACLGGHALMGPLFGLPLLLVEGDDDYRIWSQVPRHHVVSFAVIPTNGDEIHKYQKTLEQILNSLRSSGLPHAGYALLDGDKPLPQPNPNNPQSHVRFLKLSCHEAENLYLTDEVLGLLDTNWSRASATIAAQSGGYGNKQSKLAQAHSWNRQTDDLKHVINEISQILDPKKVHWTIRVGQALGRARPQGELKDFLGEDVVTALWGLEGPVACP